MGIHRLLHSSCCFLNTNTVITRQLIGTVRMLEAEWWQVWGEAWVRGQREMSQVLGMFGLLVCTMLRPVLAWRAFWNLWTVYFFNFPIFFFFGPRPTTDNWNCRYWIRGCGGPPVICFIIYTHGEVRIRPALYHTFSCVCLHSVCEVIYIHWT